MATEFKKFKGKGKWMKIFVPDSTFGDPQYRMQLYLTPEGVIEFKKLGVKNKVNTDEDGSYVNLKRDVSKIMRGQTVSFSPPIVVDKEGNPFKEGSIGNGSDLTVTVEHYAYNPKTGGGPAHAIRLHTVQVDNLVPYQPNVTKETVNEPVTEMV